MMRIYYRWIGDCKYEFYIDTGKRDDNSLLNVSLMIIIYIVGGGKVSNKKGRIKKRLMSPPETFVIGTGESWCYLTEDEKRCYLDLTKEEFRDVLIMYEINKVWSWKI
jgi:hypothetical protein